MTPVLLAAREFQPRTTIASHPQGWQVAARDRVSVFSADFTTELFTAIGDFQWGAPHVSDDLTRVAFNGEASVEVRTHSGQLLRDFDYRGWGTNSSGSVRLVDGGERLWWVDPQAAGDIWTLSDVNSGEVIRSIDTGWDSQGSRADVLPDGTAVLSLGAGQDGVAVFWALVDGRQLRWDGLGLLDLSNRGDVLGMNHAMDSLYLWNDLEGRPVEFDLTQFADDEGEVWLADAAFAGGGIVASFEPGGLAFAAEGALVPLELADAGSSIAGGHGLLVTYHWQGGAAQLWNLGVQ